MPHEVYYTFQNQVPVGLTQWASPNRSYASVNEQAIYAWVQKPKVVFSTSLRETRWNTRVVQPDALEEVERLKHESNHARRPASQADQSNGAGQRRITRISLRLGGSALYVTVESEESPYLVSLFCREIDVGFDAREATVGLRRKS